MQDPGNLNDWLQYFDDTLDSVRSPAVGEVRALLDRVDAFFEVPEFPHQVRLWRQLSSGDAFEAAIARALQES